MSFYQLNTIYLKELAPSLYEHLKLNEALVPVELQPLEEYNFRIKKGETTCFLHSLYNKAEELDLMFQHVPEDVEVIVLFGLGCGYALEYIRLHYLELKNLVLVEPCLQLFESFLEEKSLVGEFIDIKNTIFVINVKPEDATSLIVDNLSQNMKNAFVNTFSYRLFCSEYYHQLNYLVSDRLRNRVTDYITLSYQITLWTKNTLSNLKTERVLIDHLYKTVFADRPVVIISAGPSLNKHLPYLAELKKKAILLAVGSAIKVLDKYGVAPHFRVAVDGSKITEDLIFDEALSHKAEIPLIYVNQIYQGIISKYPGKKFLTLLTSDSLGYYLYAKMQEAYEIVSSSHSVANVTFNFLCLSGCKTIILLGQDMCFYDKKLHAEGREAQSSESYDQQKLIACKDIFGNTVYSIRQYTSIKDGYETTLKEYPNMQVINATEGGLGIEGTTLMPLVQVMDEVLTENLNVDIGRKVEEVWNQQYTPVLLEKQYQALIGMQKEIIKIKKINNKRLYLLKKIHKKKTKGINKNRVENDIQYLTNLEEQLSQIPFYVLVAYGMLSTKNEMDKMFYSKEEKDTTERELKILFGVSLELEKYLELIEEFLTGEGLKLCEGES